MIHTYMDCYICTDKVSVNQYTDLVFNFLTQFPRNFSFEQVDDETMVGRR